MELGEAVTARRDALAILVLRTALGTLFWAHGMQLVFGAFGGGGFPGAVAVAEGAGFQPAALWGPVLAFAAFLGGLAVLLGFYTRVAAALMMFIMAVAVVQVQGPMGYFNSRGGFEFPLTVFFAALSLLLTGSGAYSLDTWLRLRLEGRLEQKLAAKAAPPEPEPAENDAE